MDTCENLAIRITPRTRDLIGFLNGGDEPNICEDATYFVVMCFGTDHEITDTFDENDFKLAFGELLLPYVVAQYVTVQA